MRNWSLLATTCIPHKSQMVLDIFLIRNNHPIWLKSFALVNKNMRVVDIIVDLILYLLQYKLNEILQVTYTTVTQH